MNEKYCWITEIPRKKSTRTKLILANCTLISSKISTDPNKIWINTGGMNLCVNKEKVFELKDKKCLQRKIDKYNNLSLENQKNIDICHII